MDDTALAEAYREARLTRQPNIHARPDLDPDTRKAREAEKNRRSSLARSRVLTALRHLHPDEYAALYRLALDEIQTEKGPLPGDEA